MNDYLIIIFLIIFLLNECINLKKYKKYIKIIICILAILLYFLDKQKLISILNDYTGENIKFLNKHISPIKTFKNKNKRKLSESKKKIVAASQKWKCNSCLNILNASYEIDHIIPLYHGGSNDLNNLQALCRNCHGQKTLYDSFL